MSNLTKHKAGSMRELWAIAFPLILSSMSGTLMLFIDRIILAQYSTAAMNAASSGGMIAAVLQYGPLAVAAIAGVFVGQMNGAGKKTELGKPVWQMIYFALGIALISVPLGLLAGGTLLHPDLHTDGIPYFRWTVSFAFLMPLSAAISAFFIGQGKTKITLWPAYIGNGINVILDIILIFGYKDIIPALGAEGAAIATVVSMATQVLILLAFFLTPNNIKNHGALLAKFDKKTFMGCIKIGTPNALGHTIEISAWAVLLGLMASVSEEHITALAIGQNIFILFIFTTDGMQKAITSVASNFIGSEQYDMVRKTLRSGFKLAIALAGAVAIPLLFFPELLIEFFESSNADYVDLNAIMPSLKLTMVWVWLCFLLDSIQWVASGVLTAGGDTKYAMFAVGISAWVLCVAPCYVLMVKMGYGGLDTSWQLACLAVFASMILILFRYKSGIWKKGRLTADSEESFEDL